MKTGILVSCAVVLTMFVGAAEVQAGLPAKSKVGYCLKELGFPIPDDLKAANTQRRPNFQSGRSATQNAVQNVARGATAAAIARAQQAQAQAQAQQNQTTQQTTQSNNGVTSTTATQIVVPDANQAPSQPSALQQLHAQNQGQLTNTFGGLLKEFQRRACYVIGDADAVRAASSNLLNVDSNAFLKNIQVAQGRMSGRLSEPGLLGLQGAEGVVRELLTAEVSTIWILSEANGATGYDLTQEVIDGYVNANIDNLRRNPDTAISLRMRVWERLVEMTLDNTLNTPDEQDFIRAFEAYIKGEYVRMANTVEEKWDDHKTAKQLEENTRADGKGKTGVSFSSDTYDPRLEVKRNTAMASHSAVLVVTSALGRKAIKKNQSNVYNRLVDKANDLMRLSLDDADDELLEGVDDVVKKSKFNKVTKSIVLKLGKTAAGRAFAKSAVTNLVKVGVKLAIKLGLKAVNVVPFLGQILDFVISMAMEIPDLIEAGNKEAAIQKIVTTTKAKNISLRNILNTREGYDIALMFFSRATGSSSPATVEIEQEQQNACQACFYTQPGFVGEGSCTQGLVDNLSTIPNSTKSKNFDNVIRSVRLFRDESCPQSNVVLYENERGTGEKVTIRDSVGDLMFVAMENPKEHWAAKASSLEFKGASASACEVCLYDNTNFRGARSCIGASIGNLSGINMNERISSIKFNTKACPDAKIWAYHKPDFKRQQDTQNDIAEYSRSVGNVGTVHNDAFSSIYFSEMGVNTLTQKADAGCRACLYEHTNFRGEYVCLSFTDQGMAQAGNSFTAIPKLSEVSSVDSTVNFGNKASSVQFITDHCNPGDKLELELHTDSNYRGDMTLLTKSSGNLGRFNDRVYSVRLKAVSEEATRNNMCRVCVYDGKNYNGDKRCVTAKMSLQMLKFSNKASSLKFETPGCSKTAAATFFDGEMKGDRAFTYKDIPDLSKIRRGAKGNWDNRTSYIDFGPALKTNLEQWYLRNKQKTPWVN